MNIKLLSILLFISLSSYSQNNERCATNEHMHELYAKNPHLLIDQQKYESELQQWIVKQQGNTKATVVTIPVVVHVVYNNSAQNISDAQVLSQIDVLNEDFRKLNSDFNSGCPVPFQPLAADCQIEFCMAQRDPNGNPTNGIVRKSTSVSSFSYTSDNVKFDATGGSDQWDPSKYFNIWVCKLSGGVLGYGEFPGSSFTNTYGCVLDYQTVGRPPHNPNPGPYNLGRTGTHEVGHCFNLRHIWGDAYCGNDLVSDTPVQQSSNGGCPSFPKTSPCSGNGSNGDMFMNYMDYVNDNCMVMFSQGQSTRMNAVLNTTPYNALKTSNGCIPPGGGGGGGSTNDAGISAVISPTGAICGSQITPQVTLKNFGSNPLTSVGIKYQIDGGTAVNFNWTGTLASGATTNVTLSSTSVSSGSHTINAYTENPNGSPDANTSNDASTSNFSNQSSLSLPLSEGFESTTFPPAGWDRTNSDNNKTWARTTSAAKSGNASAYMDNYNYTVNGERDELISPLFSGSNPILTFDVAYRLYTDPTLNPNYSDTLIVYMSTNCGASWTEVYKKFGANLTTVTPNYSSSMFVPTSAQWRNEMISLSTGGNPALIKFVNVTDYENQLYLDNINITSTTTYLNELSGQEFLVYPNPTSGVVHIKSSEKNQ